LPAALRTASAFILRPAVKLPTLKAWDRGYASPAEPVLAKEANARSGLRSLAG
jgi:hypothetical protein